MKKKQSRSIGPMRLPNPANLASRLRRIRNELSLMTQACDDALERLDQGGDDDHHQRSA